MSQETHAGQWIASGLTIPVQELSSYLGHLHDRYHALLDSGTVHPLVLAAGLLLGFAFLFRFQVGLMLAGLALFSTIRVLGMLSGAEDGKPERPEED